MGNVEPPTCTHCHITGHIAEKCYKLHGYPPGHKLHPANKNFTANATVAIDETAEEIDDKVGLTEGPYQQLLSLLQSKDSSLTHFVNHA